MTTPVKETNVVRINLNRLGAVVGLGLFLIQMVTIIVVWVRSDAKRDATIIGLTVEVSRLVTANEQMVEAVKALDKSQALNTQRIDVLEKANPPGRARP